MNLDLKNEVVVEKKEIQARRRARKLALQALYQWHMSGAALVEIEAQFRAVTAMDKVDDVYFCRLLYDIPKYIAEIENAFVAYLDRPVESLNPIELTALRIGAFELLYSPEIPCLVVLDESVSLCRAFGSQDGHRYVNGVLNNLARQVRSIEMGA